MTAAMPLNLREPVSAQVHQARWAVEQLWGLVGDWTPPAARPFLEERVEGVARQILAAAPAGDPRLVGCAVFKRTPVFGDRLYRNGFLYEPVSAVFEDLGPAETALAFAREKRDGDHVICWLTEHQ